LSNYITFLGYNVDGPSQEEFHKYWPADVHLIGKDILRFHTIYWPVMLHALGLEMPKKIFGHPWIIAGDDKMSKSKGNVVSPDDLVRDYGCDSLRMYELFVGPPELDAEWDDRGIDGVNRYLKRLWNLVMDSKDADVKPTKEMLKLRNRMVYDITTRLESFSLNTVISGFMEYNNKFIELAKKNGGIDKETLEAVAVLLSPFAPQSQMKDDEIEIPVQVNGKTKVVVSIPADADKDAAIAAGKEALGDKLSGNIVKEIYVPGKIINIVAK